MDRVCQKFGYQWGLLIVILVTFSLSGPVSSVWADLERNSPQAQSEKYSARDEAYPESRFGEADRKPAESIPKKSFEAAEIRRKGVQEVALIAGDLGYFPKAIFVSRDVPVRIYVTGASKNTLCFMMDAFQIRKQVRSQRIEEITFTPDQPGKFRFYCPVNGMEGKLIVRELSTDSQSDSTHGTQEKSQLIGRGVAEVGEN